MENHEICFHADGSLQELGGGCKRLIRCYNKDMMAVEVHCDKGGLGAPHKHPHAQVSYILSGAFLYTVDGKETTLRTGDSIALAPNSFHGCVCLEAGVLLDVFSPMREDFVK